MQRLSSRPDTSSRFALYLIAAILALTALKVSAEITAPLALAVVTGVVLAPLVDGLERLGLPRVPALLVLLVVFALLSAVIVILVAPYVSDAMKELPRIRLELRSIINDFRELVRGIDEVTKDVEEALGGKAGTKDDTGDLIDPIAALTFAPIVLSQILIFSGALFFFLLTRTSIYRWAAMSLGTTEDTSVVLNRFVRAEATVSRYFLTVCGINAGLGIALWAGLTWIEMPMAAAWGVLAALLNFVVYVGPLVVIAVLSLAGLVAFDGLWTFMPPLIFLVLNMIEAQFVTPALIGRHVRINPLLVFVTLVLFIWLWGPIGGIVSIPLLAILIILIDIK